MLVFDQGDSRFNFRVAGIACRDGHVLVHRATHEAFWTFPGGRAEMGEPTKDTLVREMAEEIQSTVTPGRLLWLVENFFRYEGRDFHELGFYYEMEIAPSFPFKPGEIVRRVADGGSDIEFKWVQADEGTLMALPLYPAFIPPRIGALPATTEHVVWYDAVPVENRDSRPI